MSLYRRLGEVEDVDAVHTLAAELVDRFGKLPAEVGNLLKVIETKVHCRQANIVKLEAGAKGALISFHENRFGKPAKLVEFVQKNHAIPKLRPHTRTFIGPAWPTPAARPNAAQKKIRNMTLR